MTDYGHWETAFDFEVNDYLAFTYIIVFENGKKYIGVKKIWKKIKKPPTEWKRGPKAGFIESDWKNYTSSSKSVNELMQKGINVDRMVITGVYRTYGQAMFAEAQQQMSANVLASTEWLNGQISGQFNPACFSKDGITDEIIREYADYDINPEEKTYPVFWHKDHDRTKYVHPTKVVAHLKAGWVKGRHPSELDSRIIKSKVSKFELYDTVSMDYIKIENPRDFCSINRIEPSHMDRLLSGDLDDVLDGKYTLCPNIRRVIPGIYTIVGRFDTLKQASEATGLTVTEVKDSFERVVGETRTAYKKRLKTVAIVEIGQAKTEIQTMKYSAKYIGAILTGSGIDTKEKQIEWLQEYIKYLQA